MYKGQRYMCKSCRQELQQEGDWLGCPGAHFTVYLGKQNDPAFQEIADRVVEETIKRWAVPLPPPDELDLMGMRAGLVERVAQEVDARDGEAP